MYLRSLFIAILFCCIAALSFAQERALDFPVKFPTFQPGPRQVAAADLNADGFADVIVSNLDIWPYRIDPGTNSLVLTVHLGDGKGNFSLAGTYGVGTGGGELAVGDVTGDGQVDVVVSTDSPAPTIEIFAGDGHGGLQHAKSIALTAAALHIEVADLDLDGKNDIVAGKDLFWGLGSSQFLKDPSTGPSSKVYVGDLNGDGRKDLIYLGGGERSVLMNQGGRAFTPTSGVVPDYTHMVLADFNHDGHLDLAATDEVDGVVWRMHGVGDGTFQAGEGVVALDWVDNLAVIDADGDEFPDLAVCELGFGRIAVYQNAGNGTFSRKHGRTPAILGGGTTPISITGPNRDLIVSDSESGSFSVLISKWAVDTRIAVNPVFAYLGEQVELKTTITKPIPEAPGEITGSVLFLRYEIPPSAKTEILGEAPLQADGNAVLRLSPPPGEGLFSGVYLGNADFARSTVTYPLQVFVGGVPGCVWTGIDLAVATVCNPISDQTVSSPVAIKATGHPVRTSNMEVWIDGVKKYSAKGTTIDMSLPLPVGEHRISVYATELGAFKWKTSYLFKVADPPCTPASITAVAICAPTNTAYPTSEIRTVALGGSSVKGMEVWVDGAKKYQVVGNKVDTALLLNSGSHSMSVYGKNGTTVLDKKTVAFSSGGTTCPAPVADGVSICAPSTGASTTSPVKFLASSNVTGVLARMELWIDGMKKFTGTSSILEATLTLPIGTHQVSVYAVNTAGTKWKATTSFTNH